MWSNTRLISKVIVNIGRREHVYIRGLNKLLSSETQGSLREVGKLLCYCRSESSMKGT